jgi:hypothetical protein
MALKKAPKISKEKEKEWVKKQKRTSRKVAEDISKDRQSRRIKRKKPTKRRLKPCPKGTIRRRGKCIRVSGRNPCRGHKCPPGFKCISPADRPKCVRKKGGPKTPKNCRPGYKWNGKRCVKGGRDPKKCRPGYKWNGKRCIKLRRGGSNPGGGSKCSSILSKISSLKKAYAMCKKKGRGPKIIGGGRKIYKK